MLFELAPALRDSNPALQQYRAQLIEQGRALAHEAIPYQVQDLQVELILSLELDKNAWWAAPPLRRSLPHHGHRFSGP
jgi:hypothetical protein